MLAGPVVAQQGQACTDRTKALETLAKRYSETPMGRGITTRGHMMELIVSPDGTWTLLVSQANGDLACMVAAGEGWRQVDEPKAEGTAL